MSDIREFRVEIGDDVLKDLKLRLEATRWPEAETPDDWSQGVPLAYMQEVCGYWANDYDWRATEARLNAFPHPPVEINNRCSEQRRVVDHVETVSGDAAIATADHGLRQCSRAVLRTCKVVDTCLSRTLQVPHSGRLHVQESSISTPVFR